MPGYRTTHQALRRDRGPASGYDCADCHRPAEQWAYDGQDPAGRWDWHRWGDHARLVPYSTDPSRYRPLCRSCHVSVDRRAALAQPAEQWLTDPPTAWHAVYEAALAACSHHDAEDATQDAYLAWVEAGQPPVSLEALRRSAVSALGGVR